MTIPSSSVTAENAVAGFRAYRDPHATGTDVTATGLPFHGRVSAHRFEDPMTFEAIAVATADR